MRTSCSRACTAPPGHISGRRAKPPAGRARGARRCLLHGGADGGGPLLPHHHDQRGGARAAAAARRCRRMAARILPRHYDPRFAPAAAKTAVTLGMGMTEKQGGTDVRASTTTRRADRRRRAGRRIPHHRPQVVHVGADVGRVPRAGPGAGRAHLLSHAALPARRHGQRAALPAAEGQARQPLECLVRGRVPRRLGARHRRGGPRRRHHHRDGDAHAARLRDRLRRPDAAGARQRHPPRRAPPRVPEEARRPAADAAGARRPGARRRGGDRARVPARPRLRPCRRTRAPPPGAG